MPKLSILPEAQRAVWNELNQVPRRFVLYGGTALALRLGHRQSEDFDFFADAPVHPEELLHGLTLIKDASIRQNAPNTLTVIVDRGGPVKLSFFGLTRRRVSNPETTNDGAVRVASLLDIAAFKMAVLPARAEAKDYLDVFALLRSGIALGDALGAAQAVYGEQFNPILTLKALTYFNDGDLPTLSKDVQQTLRAAAVVEHIAHFEPLLGGLVPPEK